MVEYGVDLGSWACDHCKEGDHRYHYNIDGYCAVFEAGHTCACRIRSIEIIPWEEKETE